MSAPRTKRPFAGASVDPSQRQITSFFTTRSGPAPLAGPSPTPAAAENNLPSEVQSNLLSVGMRIRKSVPEGYKTGTYSSFKLWSDDSAPVVRTTLTTASPSTTRKQRSAANSQRELMPFCGINKIGGLSSQPMAADDYDDVPNIDDVPGLSSSQESVESVDVADNVVGDGRSRKRYFGDDDDGGDKPVQMWANHAAWLEGEVSPCSPAPSGWANARTFAVPRKSRRSKPVVEQENLALDDFEDAEFLVTPDTDMSDA
ncbi:ribonucleotide reductase inhibitor [Colletotrichum truncatum]|uniref:Ribonucleotide reductase inhibitor n=1 Tax=Colletotrichum truncatum TaxID=5467 RepID=A0ACC3YZE0_COLTU|nr:ribonucleotide reductase inhibitor [Colletotrichum truncatum]KAF6786230.1 ribonucleotide reductase inhibitor [Colletotrichum truncatum]